MLFIREQDIGGNQEKLGKKCTLSELANLAF